MTDKQKKAVVTGGAGFIGTHITRELLAQGWDVVVVDNLSGGKKSNVPKDATFHKLDVCKTPALTKIFEGADAVFHLAALPRVQFSIEFPQLAHQANVDGTLSVLVAARDAKVGRVVYSASSSVYGDQKKMPLTEDMTANPNSPYGLQKYIGEEYCKLFCEAYQLPTVCLRYFNVYGPGANEEGAYALVIAKFLKLRREGKSMTITGTGKQTRDFTHVRDVVRANILAAESKKVGKGETINIGAGHNASVNAIAKLIGGPKEYIPARLESRDSLADNSKAKRLLGWKPTVSLEEGIAELKELSGLNK